MVYRLDFDWGLHRLAAAADGGGFGDYIKNIYQKSLFSLRSSNFSKISSFRRLRHLLKMIAAVLSVLNSLSTGAVDGITELKQRNTSLTAVCLFSMESTVWSPEGIVDMARLTVLH